MKLVKPAPGEARLETIISWVLGIGLALSLALEVAGIVLYWRAYGQLTVSRDPAVFIKGRDFFSFIGEQLLRRAASTPSLLMIAGVVVLLLTPYLRVVLSVLYFASVRNLKYVMITLIVLALLTSSMLLH